MENYWKKVEIQMTYLDYLRQCEAQARSAGDVEAADQLKGMLMAEAYRAAMGGGTGAGGGASGGFVIDGAGVGGDRLGGLLWIKA